MACDSETVSDGLADRRQSPARVRRCLVQVLLPVCVILVTASACSEERAPQAAPSTSKSTATSGFVAATTPAFPPGTKVCDTVRALAGWPTTAAPRIDAYACILDALAAGTPAQMSTISGIRDRGRKTRDGYDTPIRQVVTLRVLGKNDVQVMTDLTEDGGTLTTKTCKGLEAGSLGPQGTDCS